MATLVGNAKYGEGHQIVLKDKDKLSSKVSEKFAEKGYTSGSLFSITKLQKKPNIVVDLGTGSEEILLKDGNNKLVMLVGSASSINGSFNHYSANAKSDTKILTETKEIISMMIFQAYFENNKTLTEDQILKTLPSQYAQRYDTTYYDSAIKQLAELKKYVKKGGYTYERQGQDKTAKLYTQARFLTKLANDNWNPGDVWMISKSIKSFPDVRTIAELNDYIDKGFKEKTVIPISLKNVTGDKSVSEVVSSAGAKKIDLDLSFAKVDLSDTFNNFIIQTKSGFAVRVGFKASASTLNVSIEGRMVGAGYQMGAVDAKAYAAYSFDENAYFTRGGTGMVKPIHMEKAKVELKEIIKKYPRFSNTIGSYKDAIALFDKGNKLTKERFANLISYMYSFLIVPKNFKKHMEFCYYSSKKISDKSSTYLLLK